MNVPGPPGMREQREREALEAQEAYAHSREIDVPPCDLFELALLPELCPHGGDCLEDEGCYIARIQRKVLFYYFLSFPLILLSMIFDNSGNNQPGCQVHD